MAAPPNQVIPAGIPAGTAAESLVPAAAAAEPARIVHFGTGGGSGATRVLLDVAAAQLRAGYDVRVFLRRKSKPLPASFDGVLGALAGRVVWIPNLWPKFRLVARIRAECEKFRPKIFFAHGFSEHLWGRLAALRARVPFIIHVEHNLEKYSPLRRWLARKLAAKTTATVCVSESVAERVRAIGVAAADTRVVPNGADISRFATPPVPPPEAREADIVMAARFARQKDHATLVRAFKILTDGGWRGKLFLAGGGKNSALQRCRRLVRELDLEDSGQIVFMGAVADLPALLRRCRFAVLSSHYEGLPLALVEYLAAGCVCLGSNVAGVRDVLKHDVNGLLFTAGDAAQLASQLQALLVDTEKCSALAAAGAAIARDFFSTDRMFAQYNALCAEILSARTPPVRNAPAAAPQSGGAPIVIFLSFGENYVEHARATILSVLKNAAAGARFQFHILHTNLSENARVTLCELQRQFSVEINFTPVDSSKFESLKLTLPHISIETWYRFLIPFHAAAVGRAIYLDCDLVVRGDISELWNTDLDGNYLAAVEDAARPEKGFKNYASLFPNHRYFNAGVLLLDCAKIRTGFTLGDFFEIARKHEGDFKFQGQDVLNFAFQGGVFYLPFKWNVTVLFFKPPRKLAPAVAAKMEEVVAARENPAVVHFVGKRKPWLLPSGPGASPYAGEYFKYARAGAPPAESFLTGAKNFLAYLLHKPLFFLDPLHWAMRRVRKRMG
ncbi:MAG: glycosyltransferase [Puniceicoccales bacterium]|nr:glycosyltransferase [Puniceicoccales bacterium]